MLIFVPKIVCMKAASTFLLLTGLSFALLFTACRRCEKIGTYYFHPDTRSYFSNYGEGSYWVLENSADATDRDTLTLITKTEVLEKDINAGPCSCDNFDAEGITYGLVSSETGDTLQAEVSAGSRLDRFRIQGKFLGEKVNIQIGVENETGIFPESYSYKRAKAATYSVGNTTYGEVVHFQFTDEYLTPSEATFEREKGLVELAFKGPDSERRYFRSAVYLKR